MAERISFDRSLYMPEAVEAAAAAYADFATIQLTTSGEAVVADIADAGDYDLATIANAFSNHVLHETISRRRREENA
jgi:hypothetical protein